MSLRSLATTPGIGPTGRRVLDVVLAYSPARSCMEHRNRSRLAVLAYHQVESAARFEAHLDEIAARFNAVSVDQVIEAGAGRGTLPPRSVLLTFDDATVKTMRIVAPMLQARGIPAVAFVVAGLLDTDEPFWWVEVERRVAAGGLVGGRPVPSASALVRHLKQVPDRDRMEMLGELRDTSAGLAPDVSHLRRSDLRGLESMGVTVGNHSLTHPVLVKCDPAKVEAEVVESHRVLTEGLGHPPRSFAYPNGDQDGRVREVVAAAGHEVAFVFDHRLESVPWDDPLAVSRVRVDADDSLARFRILASGLHPALHHLRRRA